MEEVNGRATKAVTARVKSNYRRAVGTENTKLPDVWSGIITAKSGLGTSVPGLLCGVEWMHKMAMSTSMKTSRLHKNRLALNSTELCKICSHERKRASDLALTDCRS
jgi:hypothetical protein